VAAHAVQGYTTGTQADEEESGGGYTQGYTRTTVEQSHVASAAERGVGKIMERHVGGGVDQGYGLGIQSSASGAQNARFWSQDSSGLHSHFPGSHILQDSEFKVQGSGSKIQDTGSRIMDSESQTQDSALIRQELKVTNCAATTAVNALHEVRCTPN